MLMSQLAPGSSGALWATKSIYPRAALRMQQVGAVVEGYVSS
jgi:hypothetical protein